MICRVRAKTKASNRHTAIASNDVETMIKWSIPIAAAGYSSRLLCGVDDESGLGRLVAKGTQIGAGRGMDCRTNRSAG